MCINYSVHKHYMWIGKVLDYGLSVTLRSGKYCIKICILEISPPLQITEIRCRTSTLEQLQLYCPSIYNSLALRRNNVTLLHWNKLVFSHPYNRKIRMHITYSRNHTWAIYLAHQLTHIHNIFSFFYIKTFKIAPTCFDPKIIFRELHCSSLNSHL